MRRLLQPWLFCCVLGICTVPLQGQKLAIDYASYLGGSGTDSAYAVATDATGAIYIAGFTQSSDLPILNALQQNYAGGTGDLFIAKLKADGSGFAYITYIGGSGGEGDPAGYVGGIAVDAHGNAYVTGITRSPDFPTTPDAFQTSIASQFVCDDDPNAGLCGDAFVLKLSAGGDRLIYSTYLGGSDYDDAKAIAVDSTGAAYITGITASPDFPTTDGAFQTQLRDVDAYVAKLSPDGSSLEYSSLIGGTGLDAGMAIAVDSQGRAYVAGTTQAADFPVNNPLQSFGGGWDAFILRLNISGTAVEFSTSLGGQGTDEALGITIGPAGEIYIAGFTDSTDFPVHNPFQPSLAGPGGNGFVIRLKSDGSSILYSTYLGGADGRSQLNGIAVDSVGNAYVTGPGGSDFPIVASIRSYRGATDAVVSKLSPDGSALLFSTFIGGSGLDFASAVALDSSNRIVITGQTSSTDFPLSPNAFRSASNGPSDAFIVRLSQSTIDGPIFSSAKLVSVGDTYTGQFSPAHPLSIINEGNQSLLVSGIDFSTNVRVSSNCISISPGSSCSISASLLVTSSGDQSGTITVYDNAPDSPQTIFVRGTGVTGGDLELSFVVTGASFSYYGKSATPITATILNHGPSDSSDVVVRVTSDDGAATCDPCYVGSIKAGKLAIARLNFVPSSYGMIPLTIQVHASAASPDLNNSNDRQSVVLPNPRYSASPSQLNFNNQTVNLLSASQRITFSSLDGRALQLSFSATGDFSATVTCDPGSLRCYADATFSPTSAGTRNGALIVTESTAGTTQTISLSGTGVLAPHVALSTRSLAFVDGVTGKWSAPNNIIVDNDGSAPLFLVSISTAGSFSQTNQCPPVLKPGESCAISVRFLSSQAGTSTGTLTITHNASNLTDVVSLTGLAVPPASLLRPIRPTSSAGGTALASRPIALYSLSLSRHVVSARSTSSARLSASPSRPATRFEIQLSPDRPDRSDR